jgi:hypothetical protein
MPQAAPAHSLGALTLGELGIPGLVLLALLWLRWFQMGASFLWKRTPEPMRRLAVGIFFSLCGLFLQSLTEWVFRHSPIYYVNHILLGALAALYYEKRQAKREARLQEEFENILPERQISAAPEFEPANAFHSTATKRLQRLFHARASFA